jgi:uncharacterized protein YndB with AHSA1/START domain
MSKPTSLTVEHVFDATPEELWNAWTHPEQYKKWYNPAPGMDLVIHEFDVRVGGRVHFDMPMPGGRGGNSTKGVFHVLEPHKRIVFGAEDKSSLNDVTIKPEGKKTRLIVVWSSTVPEMGSPEMQKMATMAWESSAAKLERLLMEK